MTASVIVTLWLLIVASLDESVLANEHPPLALLLFYFAITGLTALAVWVQLKDGAPHADAGRRRRGV